MAMSLGVYLSVPPASAIVCGEYVAGELNAGESDVHTFVAAAGDRVLLNAGDDFTPELTLTGPGNAPIALENFLGLRRSAPLPSSGIHSVTITNVGPSSGDYHLTLDSATGSFNGETNWLPNPVCGGVAEPGAPAGVGGTRILRCGESSPQGHIGPGSIDTFTFHAAAGDVIRIDNAGFDYRVHLFDDSGERVPFTEANFPPFGDLVCVGDASLGCTSTPLPSTGIYTIAVAGQDGSYQITLESVGGSFDGASNGPPTPICALPSDGTRNLCTPLPPRLGFLTGGDSDAWTFLGHAGDAATFSVTNPTPLPGIATATLWGPGGDPVTGSTLPLSGVYTLLVDRDDNLIGTPSSFPILPYAVSIPSATCRNACEDGRDNDGDGAIDGADIGCLSRDDLSEQRECNDGIDNDGDGGIDVGTRTQPGDPACSSPNLLSEDPPCNDGADNDGDKLVDFDGLAGATAKDPQCNDNPSWLSEQVLGPVSCGLGPEVALLLPALAALRARRRR
jgi:hypothetical protein